MAQLRIIGGSLVGRKFALPTDGIVIGRGTDCDLILHDTLASGRHARLSFENARWVLHDLGSSNGTLVNGVLVKTIPLGDGDIVLIGETEMKFSAGTTDTAGVVREKPRPSGLAPYRSPAPGNVAPEDLHRVERMRTHALAIRREVAKAVVGQTALLDDLLLCILAQGHALLVGPPGLAKALMVRTLSRTLDLEFTHLRLTPDLMPSELTGTEVLDAQHDAKEEEYHFIPGPIFCNLLLAEDVAHASPRTQSLLLEAMQERRVMAGSRAYALDTPFLVMATQNALEPEPAQPLSDALLDRFLFTLHVDYPTEADEDRIVAGLTPEGCLDIAKVLDKTELLQVQAIARRMPVAEHVVQYVTRLNRATRPGRDGAPDFVNELVAAGASPRAGQSLLMAAKARAILEGRTQTRCSDVRSVAIPALRHRLRTTPAADAAGIDSVNVIRRLLETVHEPADRDAGGSGA